MTSPEMDDDAPPYASGPTPWPVIAMIVAILVLTGCIVALAVWPRGIWGWVEIHGGIARGGPDPYYNAWSGILSDVGEVVLIGAILQAARHVNCHTKRCWRFGKPVAGTPYRACHHHHPAHKGDKRNVSLATIEAAHAAVTPEKVEVVKTDPS